MTTYYRRLLPSDLRSMQRLRMDRHTHAGSPVSVFTNTPILNIDLRYFTDPHHVIGAFEEDRLVAFICAYSHEDFWVLDLMVSSKKPGDLHGCLNLLLGLYETRGVNTFYYAFPEKWARAYRSFWRNGAPLLRRYVIEDVGVIEARKIPEPFIWDHILHNVVIPINLFLRRSRLP